MNRKNSEENLEEPLLPNSNANIEIKRQQYTVKDTKPSACWMISIMAIASILVITAAAISFKMFATDLNGHNSLPKLTDDNEHHFVKRKTFIELSKNGVKMNMKPGKSLNLA